MTQKITQMRLARYLFTAVLALLFVNCSKGHSADEPKSNNGAQTSSSKQVEDEIGFGQRELTLRVGETSKVTLHGVRSPRIETSNSNLVEATLIEQGTAVSLKGLQVGEGTIRVFSGNRYAELRVVVKANEEDSNNLFNGKNIVWDEISSDDCELSADGLTLVKLWNNKIKNFDMNRDPLLRKIKVIGPSALKNCRSLTSINISSSVTTIGGYAFEDCRSLTSIHIPNSVTRIWGNAFANCSSLISIHIPNSVTRIEKDAFASCTGLTSIDIPNSVKSIGEAAFYGCSNLTSINIPSSVTSIGMQAFNLCRSLTSINIPSSVTNIDIWAFKYCHSLTNINIPSSVTSIGRGTFADCDNLTSVTIPNSVTSIGESAFIGCRSLTSINIPNSVTSIEEYAFYNCSSLTSVVFKGNNPPQFSASEVFGNTPSNLKLIVPKGAKSRYIRAGYPGDKLIEQ